MFQSLKNGSQSVADTQNFNYEPEMLVSDGAEAIVKGAKLVWPGIAGAMCWAHVVPKVQKRLSKLTNKSHQVEMMNGLYEIQLSCEKQEFDKMIRLYDQKWRAEGPEYVLFLDYFKEVAVLTNSGMGQPTRWMVRRVYPRIWLHQQWVGSYESMVEIALHVTKEATFKRVSYIVASDD